jgi:hypothetical protein
MNNQPALHGVEMHVFELLDLLRVAPDIEIVKPALPELRPRGLRSTEVKRQLRGGHAPPLLPTELPGNSLLQDLHDRGGSSACWFADQQVDVLGHHHVRHQRELIPITNLIQDLHKSIPRTLGTQERQAPVATARDEVQVFETVVAFQILGHEENRKPHPSRQEQPERMGHPRFITPR